MGEAEGGVKKKNAFEEFKEKAIVYCERRALEDNRRRFHTGADQWLAMANLIREGAFDNKEIKMKARPT